MAVAAGVAKAWLRGLMVAVAVTPMASCSPVHGGLVGEAQPERVFAIGFRSIADRYVDSVHAPDLFVAGLAGLSHLDPEIAVTVAQGRVLLRRGDLLIRDWAAPAERDVRSWSNLAVQLVRTAETVSEPVRAADAEALYAAVFRTTLSGLDRYSRYASAAAARQSRASREGFGGLGISIRSEDGATRILRIHGGTPAERVGLQSDDLISHVDGAPLAGKAQPDVVDILRGPVGSRVTLTVLRGGDPRPRLIEVERGLIVVPTVTAAVEDGVLHLQVASFNQGTARTVGREVRRIEQQHGGALKGIVLDLRGNPGGLLDQAVSLADLFLAEGRIVSTRGRHSDSRQVFDATWGEVAHGLPMVVLVNGRSASSAEIVAVALRDRQRAVLVGSSSFGKGSVQTIVSLPNGGEITLTWAHLLAPSGMPIHVNGVVPAVCTSATGVPDTDARDVALGRRIAAYWALADDRDKARAACPPSDAEDPRDVEAAKLLLGSPALYASALGDGAAALAAKPRE